MKAIFTLLLFISFIFSYAQQPGTVDKTYGNSKGAEVINSNANITLMFSSALQSDDKLVVGGEDSANNRFMLSRHNKDGSIDSSFGINGKVVTEPDLSIYVFGVGNGWVSLAIQTDGKIVATGIVTKYGQGGGNNLFNTDILVARFLPDGTLDKSFGTNGVVITDLGSSDLSFDIVVQPDGKILVGGQTSSHLLVLRYNTDGSIDKSFGDGGGYVLSSVNVTTAHAITLQPDGKIVAGGGYNFDTYFFIERFMPDGTVDNSFGENGSVTTAVGSIDDGYTTDINSLAVDNKGRVIASGNNANSQIAIVRYLQDGTLDNSFDEDGKKMIVFSGGNGYRTTVLLPNQDKIVVAGYAFINIENPNADFALAALNKDGSFDSTFGTNGEVTTDFGYDENTYSAVLQSDGKIVLTGSDLYDPPFAYINARFIGYPVHVSLAVRIKRFIHNHTITWNGLSADDKVAFYSVEQSSKSNSGFTELAKVGGTSNLQNYSMDNTNLLQGMNYYRVKAVAFDGTIRYSEVVSADNSSSASVFPNPARDYITVKGLPLNETAKISITDGSGNVKVRGVSNGNDQYRSQLNNMLPGTYYVNVTKGDKTEVVKFVKE